MHVLLEQVINNHEQCCACCQDVNDLVDGMKEKLSHPNAMSTSVLQQKVRKKFNHARKQAGT